MKKFVCNPQKFSLIGTSVNHWIKSSKMLPKYRYILELISSREITILFDTGSSSFGFLNDKSNLFYVFLRILELYIWLIINKINPFSIEIVYNHKNLSKTDVVFNFIHGNFENISLVQNYAKFTNCVKIYHTSHYFTNTRSLNATLKNIKNVFLCGENNLKKNSPFFKKYLDNYNSKFFNVPFTYYDRFHNYKNFSQRENKCVAFGSLEKNVSKSSYSEVINFFNTRTIHPLRLAIYENEELCRDLIINNISLIEINEKAGSINKKFNKSGVINSLLKFPVLKVSNFKNDITKRKYYDINFNDTFNNYKMFICPEEITGLPAISFVEGMICGCVYIGEKNNMYKDLGMKDGVHYIAHEGNIESVLDRINYFKNRSLLLEKISVNGYNLAKSLFNKKRVKSIFLEMMEYHLHYKS